jgi:hypothetical protein
VSTFVFSLVVVVGTFAALFAVGPEGPFQPATVGGEVGRGDLEPPRPEPSPSPAAAPPQSVVVPPRPDRPQRAPSPGTPERTGVWRRLRSAVLLLILLAAIGVVVAGAIAFVLYALTTALHHAANTA